MLWQTQHIKNQRHHFDDKHPYSQSYDFSSSSVWIGKLDHKENWAPSYWCLQILLEKTTESPFHGKEIKSVNPKGNQPWIFIGSTDAKAEALILWHLDAKSWKKTLMLGKNEVKRRRRQQRMILLDSITNSVDMNLSKLWEMVKGRGVWCATVHGVAESRTRLRGNNK